MGTLKYTKDQVKILRENRKFAKSNGKSNWIKTDSQYQTFLGELKGAGHLQIEGFTSIQTKHVSTIGNEYNEITLIFKLPPSSGNHDKPHFNGYIQSAADVDDKPYKVKGWVNEGGSVRLEIVK
jgi:hypothetical protein